MKEVIPGIYRGSMKEAITAISTKSVDVVINLETGLKEILFGGANEELKVCIARDVKIFDFALSPVRAPQLEDVQAIFLVLTKAVVAKQRVLIHCRHGRERTGFIVAVFRIAIMQWSFETALKEWQWNGCRWPYYLIWKKRLKECQQLS